MWYALTIDFKIMFFLFLKKLYSFQAKRFLNKYHELQPKITESIKLQTIIELERFIKEIDEWIITFEKEVQIATKQLELNQALYTTSPTLEHQKWVERMTECVKQYQENLTGAQNTRKDTEQKLRTIQHASKILVSPFRNPMWKKFLLMQIEKRQVKKLVRMYSNSNRKFF